MLESGETTPDVLDIQIDNTGMEEDFNVIVVQECAPVVYDEDNQPAGDWDNVSGTQEAQGEEAGEG